MKRFLLGFLLPVAILVAAGFGARALMLSRETAKRSEVEVSLPLVEVARLNMEKTAPKVVGTGVVEAAREVSLASELNGRVTYVSPKLVVGGQLRKGERLIQLDTRNYELLLRERRSQLEKAKVELELEQGRGQLAKQEWEMLSEAKGKASGSRIVLREPQRMAAEVAVEAAEAALSRVNLDRSRTVIRAPFNATVRQESVEVGQVLAPGVAVAKLVGTDEFWVHTSIRMEELGLIDLPSDTQAGSSARVTAMYGAKTNLERQGQVIRLISTLDRESRMATVIVSIKNPLDEADGKLPLLEGAFVRVEIEGQNTDEYIRVPRLALFDGNKVWVVDSANTIHRREIKIAWQDHDAVYVVAGVRTGEQVVTSHLVSAIEGMTVRLAKNKEAQDVPERPAA